MKYFLIKYFLVGSLIILVSPHVWSFHTKILGDNDLIIDLQKSENPKTHFSMQETIETEEIFKKYKTVSTNFLKKEKRKFVEANTHFLLIDFMNDYASKKPSTIDITTLSSRSIIYLLKEIINYKLRFKTQPTYWKPEQKQYSGNVYDVWVDQKPTVFKIKNGKDEYQYKLEGNATNRQPGNASLFGLNSSTVAEKYDDIEKILAKTSKETLEAVKKALIKRKKGVPISTFKEGNKLLNGISLLFDFEVARRLVNGDKFESFPVVAVMPYLLDSFEKKETREQYFKSIFSGEERDNAIKEIIKKHKRVNVVVTKKKIRESLKNFHADSEYSSDEYN